MNEDFWLKLESSCCLGLNEGSGIDWDEGFWLGLDKVICLGMDDGF
jgi:hypothetical protein